MSLLSWRAAGRRDRTALQQFTCTVPLRPYQPNQPRHPDCLHVERSLLARSGKAGIPRHPDPRQGKQQVLHKRIQLRVIRYPLPAAASAQGIEPSHSDARFHRAGSRRLIHGCSLCSFYLAISMST
jgi:hypothetical protein